ncbi:MAG TPA: alpha/beta hydrolase [Acidimicrobiales bacterium]|jgi:acetyl esterase/lipase|nr:alpha/beta hydrolase [Acidimicrobiales bacterium]
MIDPELAAVLDFIPVFDLDDPVAARTGFEKLLVSMRKPLPEADLLEIEDRLVPGWEDDPEVSVRVYRPKAAAAAGPGSTVPGILLIHGGGFIVGSVEAEHVGAVLMAVDAGAVLVSVDYRLAPEHPYPAGLHDCYAALSFLHAQAGSLDVDPARIALVGTSAGGGLAAATALLARDRGGPAVCFQMLHIPELDDRLETHSMRHFVDAPMWNTPLAVQSWKAYLGDLAGAADVPAYAAPARATDLSGLPPAYVSTAENDPLRDEGIAYALALLRAGVSVELHQFPGTFHGSTIVARAMVSRRANKEAAAVLRRALGVVEE